MTSNNCDCERCNDQQSHSSLTTTNTTNNGQQNETTSNSFMRASSSNHRNGQADDYYMYMNTTSTSLPQVNAITIAVKSDLVQRWLLPHVISFEETHPGVSITLSVFDEHEDRPKSGNSDGAYIQHLQEDAGRIYAGFIVPGGHIADLDQAGLLRDLTDDMISFVIAEQKDGLIWLLSDVLPYYRMFNSIYDDKYRLVPLSDDANLLYYRKDLFEAHNRTVPRDWDEYIEEARYFHEMKDNSTIAGEGGIIYGSCLRRLAECGIGEQLDMIHGTIAQTAGTASGTVYQYYTSMAGYDESSFVEALRVLEEQVKYSSPDDFSRPPNDDPVQQSWCLTQAMMEGNCALSYGPPARMLAFHTGFEIQSKIGIAPLPGSNRVLDRAAGKVVECTQELCRYGYVKKDDEGVVLVNYAPYVGNSGLAGGVNDLANPMSQQIMGKFLLHLVGKSLDDAVPYANEPRSVIGPYRRSHLDVETWKQRGYDDDEFLSQMAKSFYSVQDSGNKVVSPRIGISAKWSSHYSNEVYEFISSSRYRNNTYEDRKAFAEDLTTELNDMIDDYGRGTIFAQYNHSIGLDVMQPSKVVHIDLGFTIFGAVISSLITVTSCGLAFHIWRNRYDPVIRLSQPNLLCLICLSSILMSGVSGLLLVIDDRWLTLDGCSSVCTVIAFTFFIGKSLGLGVLLSKIMRMEETRSEPLALESYNVSKELLMQALKQSILPNIVLLIFWFIVDTPVWEQRYVDEIRPRDTALPDSAGRCNYRFDGRAGTVMLRLLTIFNIAFILYELVRLHRIKLMKNKHKHMEKGRIQMILYLQLFTWIAIVPIIRSQQSDIINNSQFAFTLTCVHFFIALNQVLLLVLPPILFREGTIKHIALLGTDQQQIQIRITSLKRRRTSLLDENEKLKEQIQIMA